MEIRTYDQRLRKHDWTYRESDTLGYYQRGKAEEAELAEIARLSPQHQQLWDAYKASYGTYGCGRAKDAYQRLDQTRMQVGAITQAELDAFEAKRRAEQIHQEQRKRQQLVGFDAQCQAHDWYYWKHPIGTHPYRRGFEQRAWLLKFLPHDKREENVYCQLFYAYARYFGGDKAGLDQLNELRERLKLD